MTKLYLPISADAFEKRRREKGISLGVLARRCGYQNTSRGSNRVKNFFETGRIHQELFGKLAEALGIDQDEIERLREGDHREFERWLDIPIRPYLVVRIMAAVYCPKAIPDEVVTEDELKRYAARVAVDKRMRVALVVSRRLTIYFDKDGKETGYCEPIPGEPNVPYSTMRGRKVEFLTLE